MPPLAHPCTLTSRSTLPPLLLQTLSSGALSELYSRMQPHPLLRANVIAFALLTQPPAPRPSSAWAPFSSWPHRQTGKFLEAHLWMPALQVCTQGYVAVSKKSQSNVKTKRESGVDQASKQWMLGVWVRVLNRISYTTLNKLSERKP